MEKRMYDPLNHGSFAEEWGVHKNNREWWYATGVLQDEEGNLYSYQYTLLHLSFGPVTPKVGMVALTDFTNKRHYYLQCPSGLRTPVRITESEASIGDFASAVKGKNAMRISLRHKDFSLDVIAQYGKGAVWHCDDGFLRMGAPGEKETTLYYSYPNMPSEAVLKLNGKTLRLTGKTWFDKQGGPYNMFNPDEHWEWFSLRFFDDEEMMLFTFPHSSWFDGTYIRSDGSYERMHLYSCRATKTIHADGLTWSAGWEISVPHKEEHYTIEPIQNGHMNFAYFEELCTVRNEAGIVVGYCFAELLPGVRLDKNTKIDGKKLFRRIEI